MNKYIIIGVAVIAVIIAGAVFLGLGTSNTNTNSDTTAETNEFETFASIPFADYDGNEVFLEEFRGEPLVINSWAVWCPFCKKELSDFAKLQKEFEGEVIVIAIDRQESLRKAKGFTDSIGVSDDMLFLLDGSDSFYKSIGGFSMPETVFVNSAGEIVVHKRGPMELDEMREHTQKIINNSSSKNDRN